MAANLLHTSTDDIKFISVKFSWWSEPQNTSQPNFCGGPNPRTHGVGAYGFGTYSTAVEELGFIKFDANLLNVRMTGSFFCK